MLSRVFKFLRELENEVKDSVQQPLVDLSNVEVWGFFFGFMRMKRKKREK